MDINDDDLTTVKIPLMKFFCNTFLSKGDRIINQMIQAARSDKSEIRISYRNIKNQYGNVLFRHSRYGVRNVPHDSVIYLR